MTSIGRGPRRRRSWWGTGLSHRSFSSLTSATQSGFRWSHGGERLKLSCKRDDWKALEITTQARSRSGPPRHSPHLKPFISKLGWGPLTQLATLFTTWQTPRVVSKASPCDVAGPACGTCCGRRRCRCSPPPRWASTTRWGAASRLTSLSAHTAPLHIGHGRHLNVRTLCTRTH